MISPTAQQAPLVVLLPFALLLLFTLLRPAQYRLRRAWSIYPFILAAILIAVSAILALLDTDPAPRFLFELLGRLIASLAIVALLHPATFQNVSNSPSDTTVSFLPHHHTQTSASIANNGTPLYHGGLPKPILCWSLLAFVVVASIVSILSSLGFIVDQLHPIPLILSPLLLLIACIIPTPFLLFTFNRILKTRGLLLLFASQALCAVSYIIPCFQTHLLTHPDLPGIVLFGKLEVVRAAMLFLWISTCMLFVYLLHTPNSSIMAPSPILSETGDNVTSSFMHTATTTTVGGRMSMSTSTLVQTYQPGGLPVRLHNSNTVSTPQGRSIIGAHWNWPGGHQIRHDSLQQPSPSDRLLNHTSPPTSPGTSCAAGNANVNNTSMGTGATMMPVQIPPSPSDDFLVSLHGDPFASCPSSPVPTFSSFPPSASSPTSSPSHLISTPVTFAIPPKWSPALASSSFAHPLLPPPSSFSGSGSAGARKVRKERSNMSLTNLSNSSRRRGGTRSSSALRTAAAAAARGSSRIGTETRQEERGTHCSPEPATSTGPGTATTAAENSAMGRIRRVFSDPTVHSSAAHMGLLNFGGREGSRSANTSFSSTRSRKGRGKGKGKSRDANEYAEDVAFLACLVQNALDMPNFLPGGDGDVSTTTGTADTLAVRATTPPPKADVEAGVKQGHEIGIGLPIRSSPIAAVEKELQETKKPSHRRSTSSKHTLAPSIRSHNHGTPHPDSPFRSRFPIPGMSTPPGPPSSSPYSSRTLTSSARDKGGNPIVAIQFQPGPCSSVNSSLSRRRPPPPVLNLDKISSDSAGSGSGSGTMDVSALRGVIPIGEEDAEDPPGSTTLIDGEIFDVSSPNLADVSDFASIRSRSAFSSVSTFASTSPSDMSFTAVVGGITVHSEGRSSESRPSTDTIDTISSLESTEDLVEGPWRRRPGIVALLPVAAISVEAFGPVGGDEDEALPLTSRFPSPPPLELSDNLPMARTAPTRATRVVNGAQSAAASHMTFPSLESPSSRSPYEHATRPLPPLPPRPPPLPPPRASDNSSARLRDSLSYVRRESSSLTDGAGELRLGLGLGLGIPSSLLSASGFRDSDGSQTTITNIGTGAGVTVGHRSAPSPSTSVRPLSYPYLPSISPAIVTLSSPSSSSSSSSTSPIMKSPASAYFSTFSASSPITPSPMTPYSMFTSRSSSSTATTTTTTMSSPPSSPGLSTPRTPYLKSVTSSGAGGSGTSASMGKKWALVEEEEEGERLEERGEDVDVGHDLSRTVTTVPRQQPRWVSREREEGVDIGIGFGLSRAITTYPEPHRRSAPISTSTPTSPVHEGANRVLSFFSRSSRSNRLSKTSHSRSKDGSVSMSAVVSAGGAPGPPAVFSGQKRLGTANSGDSDLAFELQEFGVRSPDGEDVSFRRDTDRSHPVIEEVNDDDAEEPSRRRGLDLDSVTEELGLTFSDEATTNKGSWIAWR